MAEEVIRSSLSRNESLPSIEDSQSELDDHSENVCQALLKKQKSEHKHECDDCSLGEEIENCDPAGNVAYYVLKEDKCKHCCQAEVGNDAQPCDEGHASIEHEDNLPQCSKNGEERVVYEAIRCLLESECRDNEAKRLLLKCIVEKKCKYLLHFAVEECDLEGISAAIDLGCGVNTENENGKSPMYLATLGGNSEVMELLAKRGGHFGCVLHCAASLGNNKVIERALASGADINMKDEDGKTPLYRAAEEGHVATMEYLLQNGAEFDLLLVLAAKRGDVKAVKTLISCGANLHCEDEEGKTALYRAAQGGHQEVMSVLLEKGARRTYLLHKALKAKDVPSVKNFMVYATENKECLSYSQRIAVMNQEKNIKEMFEQGENPGFLLLLAVKNCDLECVRWLVDCGADVNFRDDFGLTPMYRAAETGDTQIMQLLRDCGVDLEEEVKDNKRLLHWAVQGKCRTAVEALLKIGAELNSKTGDRLKESALHIAARHNEVDIMCLLLNKGAQINIKDVWGATPLYRAAVRGHADSARLLLLRGAEVNTRDNDGWTALHRAVCQGHLPVVKILLEFGAHLNLRTAEGWTSLGVAAKFGCQPVAAVLRSRGGII